jgi:hypothetical protein
LNDPRIPTGRPGFWTDQLAKHLHGSQVLVHEPAGLSNRKFHYRIGPYFRLKTNAGKRRWRHLAFDERGLLYDHHLSSGVLLPQFRPVIADHLMIAGGAVVLEQLDRKHFLRRLRGSISFDMVLPLVAS